MQPSTHLGKSTLCTYTHACISNAGAAAAARHQARLPRGLRAQGAAAAHSGHLRGRARGRRAPEPVHGHRREPRKVPAHRRVRHGRALLRAGLLAQLQRRVARGRPGALKAQGTAPLAPTLTRALALFAMQDDGFTECPSEGCAQDSCLDFLLRQETHCLNHTYTNYTLCMRCLTLPPFACRECPPVLHANIQNLYDKVKTHSQTRTHAHAHTHPLPISLCHKLQGFFHRRAR